MKAGIYIKFCCAIFACVLAAGCAVPSYSVKTWKFKGSRGYTSVPSRSVKVVFNDLPDGLSLDRSGEILRISDEFSGRYKIVGAVLIKPKFTPPDLRLRQMLWYVPLDRSRHSAARRVFCAAQAPFRALTLGLWNIVPLNYPCFASYPKEGNKNLGVQLKNLKKAAARLGGNLVVVAKVENVLQVDKKPVGEGKAEVEPVPVVRLFAFVLRDAELQGVKAAKR